MLRSIIALCLLFTVVAEARPGRVGTEVDDQAIDFLSPDEWHLYDQAVRLVLESPFAPANESSIILTTSDSEITADLLGSAGAELPPDAISMTIERPRIAVVLFWDRIQRRVNPEAALIYSLGREILGGVPLLHAGAPVSADAQLTDEIHILRTLLQFLRHLPNQNGYYMLGLGSRFELEAVKEEVAEQVRELQGLARQVGVCGEILMSQDN